MIEQNPQSKTRLLAKVLRDVLSRATFATLADLTDALKCRCADLKIGNQFTNDDISAVFQWVSSNRSLSTPTAPVLEPGKPESLPLTRFDAAVLFGELQRRYQASRPAPVVQVSDGPDHFPGLVEIP